MFGVYNFWSMKKVVLVTGGAGHVGSHIIEQLVSDKTNRVISLDNYFTGRVENHINGAEYRRGHTKDIQEMVPEKIDILFHLGEYARIAPSLTEPETVYDLNTLGTFAVVEYCRKNSVKKLVYAASSTKFATQGEERNKNPYSFTKANNVDLIKNYGTWYGLPYVICYFYNAFGPRECGVGKYATLIAKFEQTYLKGRPFTVDKPGTQKRNFTYVGDLARGMIMSAELGNGDGYALGATRAHSIVEIAEAFGGHIKFVDGYPGRMDSGDAPNKARDELGWETTVDIIDYIHDFVSQNPR